jgi:response regulator RpfG family c-di-GMP phosphodiesterase
MLPCVLVIDDSQTTLDLYYDLLNSDKYELELSNYEFEDPGLIEHLKPSLIIFDFKVFHRSKSWLLFDEVKTNQRTSSIPIIICTPLLEDIRQQEHYLKDQGIVIFYKPFKLDKLVQKVQEILNRDPPETK